MSTHEKILNTIERMEEAKLDQLLPVVEAAAGPLPELKPSSFFGKLFQIQIDAAPDFSARAGMANPEEVEIDPNLS